MAELLTSATLSSATTIRHAFFTREVGDCGWPRGAGDAAEIARNRGKVALALGVPPERLLSCHQVHAATVVTLEPEGFPNGITPEADAMVTNHPRLALGILTADCAPVLFADPEAHVIGAAHAGWRGAIGGALENTLTAMEKLGAKRKHILAVIGPCIGPNSYEVGPDFPAPFLAEDPENEKFFRPQIQIGVTRNSETQKWDTRLRGCYAGASGQFAPESSHAREGGHPIIPFSHKLHDTSPHYLFDLPGYIQNKLYKLGLNAVEPSQGDTYADQERFFSYRRACQSGNPVTGRLISVIMLVE